MQKINLLLLMTIVFSVGLLASCSDDAGSNTVIDVPAKRTAAKESSFDYKITKPCEFKENAHEMPSKNYDLDADGDISDEELERYLNDLYTHEDIDFLVNEDGSATVTLMMFQDCGGINTIDYEIVNDTLYISGHYYFWEKVYDPDIGDSVLVNVGYGVSTCRGCEAEFELNVPAQFVGAKYVNIGFIYNIVYKKNTNR